ncbi:MAG TPA: DUF4331 domain-containing protein [Fimbriimonadaceae bacterium]|nr:DUF4331 domain-containing protein [Fimbriimonadaceae bacterium]
MNRTLKTLTLGLALGAATLAANAASHNDAPLIMTDPSANISDVYAFISKSGNQSYLNLMMNVIPLEDPGNGVNYYRFADDVQYSFHINKALRGRDGALIWNGRNDITYNFRFTTRYKNKGTILSYGLGTEAGPILNVGDARQNLTQTYVVERVTGGRTEILNRSSMAVPPVNVGPRTTPAYYDNTGRVKNGATMSNDLDDYTRQTIYTLRDGTRVFAGQRDDPFYADVPGIFDLLGVRNPGKDGFSGFNVHSITLQIPLGRVVGANEVPMVGAWATTSRRKTTVLATDGDNIQGPWIQVGRMGNPLFNETLVALRDKDLYNRETPSRDPLLFKKYAQNCELAFLLNTVFGTPFQVQNRNDLVDIFIPDLLRVDCSTAGVPVAGQSAFHRLSFLGGDTIQSPFQSKAIPSGWPNGRRPGDDVVDIALTAIASGPQYSTITSLGDFVDTNDMAYNQVFPYLSAPHGGPTGTLH